MPPSQLRILISGAGIAGPCLAYWLSRTRLDVSITIVERAPGPRISGQAIDIRGAAVDIIKLMGLEEAVRERHTTEQGTRVLKQSGEPLAEFLADDTSNSPTAEHEILRADLSDLFLQASSQLDNVHYRYDDSVSALKQSEKSVTVTFSSGSTEVFDMFVAADGSTSKTRPMVLSGTTAQTHYNFLGQYTAFFSIPAEPTDTKHWYWHNMPGGLMVSTRPHRDGKTAGAYLCLTTRARGVVDAEVETAMDAGPEAQKQILQKRYEGKAGATDRVLAGMHSCDDFYMSRIAMVKADRWTNGRAALLGDAAHATFGVGTSLCIEGAYTLAGELGKIRDGEEIPEALARFETVFRKSYDELMKGAVPMIPQLGCPQSGWVISLRNALIWFVAKTKIYKWFSGGDGDKTKVKTLPEYQWK